MAEDNPELQHALQELDRELEVRDSICSFLETYTNHIIGRRHYRERVRNSSSLTAIGRSRVPARGMTKQLKVLADIFLDTKSGAPSYSRSFSDPVTMDSRRRALLFKVPEVRPMTTQEGTQMSGVTVRRVLLDR
jgi:hypothetical protein